MNVCFVYEPLSISQLINPSVGFYFCQPLLDSGRQLISSNIVPLQPPSFYQQRRIRPCLINEFQNSSTPFCAQQGIMLGPNQIIIVPIQAVIETLQYVSPTGINNITPSPFIPQVTSAAMGNIGTAISRTKLIASVAVGVVLLIISMLIIIAVLILIQVTRKKYEFPEKHDSKDISNSERCKLASINPPSPPTTTITMHHPYHEFELYRLV